MTSGHHRTLHGKAIVRSEPAWVRVVQVTDDSFSDDGLALKAGEMLLPWSAVRRVALGYEIHAVALADWDFWAFQGEDPRLTYWVDSAWNSSFSSRIRKRFEVAEVPPMKDWHGAKFCIRTYVVWPKQDVGRPLYLTIKKHWWSWRGRLAYSESALGKG